MSPAYRLAAAIVCLSCATAGWADDAVSAPACASDVCVINVLSAGLIPASCAGDSVLLAYSKASGATVIQCSNPSNAQDNKAFIYDRLDYRVKPFEVLGGRFIRPDSFGEAQKNGVPDKFGPVPLCAVKDQEAPVAGELLIVQKRTNDSDSAPYCYQVNYVLAGKGSLTVRSDDGRELPALSEPAALQWGKAGKKLAGYIDGGHSASSINAARTTLVISERAPLFLTPDSTQASKMYLVKGDKVEILDDSKLADGWCRVRYVTKTGRDIERWAQAQNLDVRHK
jgi:hypothetical protein